MPDLIQAIKEEIKEGKENAVSNYDLQQVTALFWASVFSAIESTSALFLYLTKERWSRHRYIIHKISRPILSIVRIDI